MLTVIAYSFFCLFTLSASDAELVQNKIKVPFANINVDFFDFLLVGPLILVGLLIYLHIFIGYWRTIPRDKVPQPLPFLFNMPSPGPRFVAGFLFYWLVPLVLLTFVWKAQPHGDVSLLMFFSVVVTGSLVWVAIRHRPVERRRSRGYRVLWLLFAALSVLGIKLAWEQAGLVGSTVVTLATAISQPLVLAVWSPEGEETGVAELPSVAPGDQVAAAPPSDAAPEPSEPQPGSAEPPTDPAAVAPPASPPAQVAQMPQQQQRAPLTRTLNLAGADLRKADLASRDLSGADLRGADLRNVVLRGDEKQGKDMFQANLSGADLRGALLDQVLLARANLEGANLEGAHFVGVGLFDARLTKASLIGAVFDGFYAQGAVLRDADFKDVKANYWTLENADLRGARNLTCAQLTKARDWESALRDESLACGASIPQPPKK